VAIWTLRWKYTAYQAALASNQSQDQMISNILQLKISQVEAATVDIEEPQDDAPESPEVIN